MPFDGSLCGARASSPAVSSMQTQETRCDSNGDQRERRRLGNGGWGSFNGLAVHGEHQVVENCRRRFSAGPATMDLAVAVYPAVEGTVEELRNHVGVSLGENQCAVKQASTEIDVASTRVEPRRHKTNARVTGVFMVPSPCHLARSPSIVRLGHLVAACVSGRGCAVRLDDGSPGKETGGQAIRPIRPLSIWCLCG